jgi:hypothetical protein
MIVVAIIALLAAIAVPGFIRARKRSQAPVFWKTSASLTRRSTSMRSKPTVERPIGRLEPRYHQLPQAEFAAVHQRHERPRTELLKHDLEC